jgi:GTPase SAR1 family protein
MLITIVLVGPRNSGKTSWLNKYVSIFGLLEVTVIIGFIGIKDHEFTRMS